MLPDPLQANDDGSAAIGQNAFTILTLEGSSSVRCFTTAAATVPNILRISHSVVGKGENARDRRLVRLEANGVEGGVRRTDIVGSMYFVADIPRNPLFTTATRDAMFRQLIGLLRGNTTYAAGSVPVLANFYSRWITGEV